MRICFGISEAVTKDQVTDKVGCRSQIAHNIHITDDGRSCAGAIDEHGAVVNGKFGNRSCGANTDEWSCGQISGSISRTVDGDGGTAVEH